MARNGKETQLGITSAEIEGYICAVRVGSQGTPLEQGYAQKLSRQYEALTQRGLEVSTMTDKQVSRATQAAIKSLRKNPKDETALLEFMALARETAFRTLGLFPNTPQLLTVLNALNQDGNVQSQVNTGEGKSLIFAMKAAVRAAQGHSVDIVSTNDILAEAHQKEFHKFFRALGFTCGLGFKDRYAKIEQHKRGVFSGRESQLEEHEHHAFDADIVYSSAHEIIHSRLADDTYNYGILKNRRRDVLLLDEADYVTLDETTRYILSGASDKETPYWIYPSINNFIDSSDFEKASSGDITKQVRKWLKKENPGQGKVIKKFKDEEITQWIRSALQAKHKALNCDYAVVEDEQIVGMSPEGHIKEKVKQAVIIDQATGELKHGSQWGYGVHQFLNARLGIPTSADSINVASESAVEFVKGYGSSWLMTGTAGSAQEISETKERFGVETFFIPPNQTSKRLDEPPALAENKDEHYKALLANIKQESARGRPVLVSFNSIRDELDFAGYLRGQGVEFQELNGLESRSESVNVIERAGKSGAVTLATTIAGRGIDIKPEQAALDAGGLHVMLTFVPSSYRIEQQVRGRAARQGAPGSSTMILNRAAEKFPPDIKTPEQITSHICAIQKADSELLAAQRKFTDETTEKLLGKYKRKFFDTLQDYYKYAHEKISRHPEAYCRSNELDENGEETKQYARQTLHKALKEWGRFTEDVEKKLSDVEGVIFMPGKTPEDYAKARDAAIKALEPEIKGMWKEASKKIDQEVSEAKEFLSQGPSLLKAVKHVLFSAENRRNLVASIFTSVTSIAVGVFAMKEARESFKSGNEQMGNFFRSLSGLGMLAVPATAAIYNVQQGYKAVEREALGLKKQEQIREA